MEAEDHVKTYLRRFELLWATVSTFLILSAFMCQMKLKTPYSLVCGVVQIIQDVV